MVLDINKEFEEKTLNSQTVFEGRVMTVIKDEIELSDGKKSFREVVLHNGGVVILAKKGDKILLVKQYRYPIKQTVLELPAGKLELGEDPAAAAVRELEEETGYRAKSWQKLGYINTTPGICSERLYLYFANDLEFVGEHPDDGEIIKCAEYKITDVEKMICDGTINDSKTICAIYRGIQKGLKDD